MSLVKRRNKNNDPYYIAKIKREIEKLGIAEYVDMMNNPSRLLLPNFLGGLARGFGVAVGFTILGALLLYILRAVVTLNLPLIGEFIADLVKIVQINLEKY